MGIINKDEYYKFESNLNAQIAIDEEKVKKGDVESMVRLARYFLTGETISFDYQNEEDLVGLWYEREDEEGRTFKEMEPFEGYFADEIAFDKGKKYAKMAADLGDSRGQLIYSQCALGYDFVKLNELDEKVKSEDLVPMDADKIDEFRKRGAECLEMESGKWYRSKTEDEQRDLEKQISNLKSKCSANESEAFSYLLMAVEAGCLTAKLELAKYYIRGKSFFNNVNTPIQDDFDQAEKLLLELSSTGEKTYLANVLLAEVYGNKKNQHHDDKKVLDCYAKITDWDSYFSADVSKDVLSSHISDLLANNSINYEELSHISLDIVKMITDKLYGKNLVDFCAIILQDSQNWLGGKYEVKEYNEVALFVYNILDEIVKSGDTYAQYKLGKALQQRCLEDSDIVLMTDQLCIKKEDALKISSDLIVEAANKGEQEAIVWALLGYDDCTLEDIEELDENVDGYDHLLFRTAIRKEEAEDYKEASRCMKKLVEKSKFLGYANRLLEFYEKLKDGSAEEFVAKFLDWSIENQLKNDCDPFYGDFILDTLVPRILDKSTDYYNPSYAIRILQSKEFESPEGYYNLGCIFSDGEHIVPNYKTARKCFEKAAQAGIGKAYYRLAYLYYYGDAGNLDLKMAKQYFEKAIFCGYNCEFAYEMVRVDLKEKDDDNLMREYADRVISKTPVGKERNKRIREDMANDFGEHWERLHKKTRDFIYSGVKTYVNNYEDDDPIFDFSAAINPMAKSLEYELGEIFYTKYKQWLRNHGVENIKEYFESIGARVSSDDDPFELGVFKYITYERKRVNTNYENTRKLIKHNKTPAIIRKDGKNIYTLELYEKFAEYVNEVFREDAFSSDERMQEITAYVINLVSQVEVIREDLRNRASHDTVMKAMHAEKCGNILYKTKKLLYSLISKIKE